MSQAKNHSLAFLILVVLTTTAAATDRASTGSLLRKAESEYSQMDFEKSLDTLEQALANSGNSRSQLVRIYLLQGICQASLNRYREARRSFARLLALDPSFRLDTNLSPRVRQPFLDVLDNGPPRLEVQLLPPAISVAGTSLVFIVRVKSDSLGLLRFLRLWFKTGDSAAYSSISCELHGEGDRKLEIPASFLTTRKAPTVVSWYAAAFGEHESILRRFGDVMHPLSLELLARREQPAAESPREGPAWYQRWWVWTIVAGVLAAGVTAAVVLVPQSPAGPHDFSVGIVVGQ